MFLVLYLALKMELNKEQLFFFFIYLQVVNKINALLKKSGAVISAAYKCVALNTIQTIGVTKLKILCV